MGLSKPSCCHFFGDQNEQDSESPAPAGHGESGLSSRLSAETGRCSRTPWWVRLISPVFVSVWGSRNQNPVLIADPKSSSVGLLHSKFGIKPFFSLKQKSDAPGSTCKAFPHGNAHIFLWGPIPGVSKTQITE